MSRPLSKNKRDVIEFSMVLHGFGPAATKGFFGLAATIGFFEPAATRRFFELAATRRFELAATILVY
jgi:hypothetical protein